MLSVVDPDAIRDPVPGTCTDGSGSGIYDPPGQILPFPNSWENWGGRLSRQPIGKAKTAAALAVRVAEFFRQLMIEGMDRKDALRLTEAAIETLAEIGS